MKARGSSRAVISPTTGPTKRSTSSRNQDQPFLNLAAWTVHTPLQATKADYDAVGDIQPERLRVPIVDGAALDRSVGRILDTLEAEGLADNTMIVFAAIMGGRAMSAYRK